MNTFLTCVILLLLYILMVHNNRLSDVRGIPFEERRIYRNMNSYLFLGSVVFWCYLCHQVMQLIFF